MKVGIESEKLEFKKTTAELKEGVISIAAMLNKHGSGELYFGVHNDGTPQGMDITDKTMRGVSQALSQHLEPKIFPDITDVCFDEKHCVHVVFHGDEAPYYAFGRAYIRVADTDKKMSASELEKFILMYYTKDIESFGTGLRRISRACEEAGVKVEFRLMKHGFAVVFYRPADHTNGMDAEPKCPYPDVCPLPAIGSASPHGT